MVKKIILISVIVIIVVVAGSFLWWKYYSNRPTSHEFDGQVEKVENGVMYANGVFVLADSSSWPIDINNPKSVKIYSNASTKFIKTVWHMPTKKELEKTGGRWDPQNLVKSQEIGSLEDFNKTGGLPVIVESEKDIFNKNSITASEILYTVQVYPD